MSAFRSFRAPVLACLFASLAATLDACGGAEDQATPLEGAGKKGKGGTAGSGASNAGAAGKGSPAAKGGSAGSTGSGATNNGGASTGGSSSAKSFTLSIAPATVDIVIPDGKPRVQAFTAFATYAGGATEEVLAAWSFDRIDVGTIAGDGKLTANGKVGGSGTVTATVGTRTATAPVNVSIVLVGNGGGPAPGGGSSGAGGAGTGGAEPPVPGGAITPEEKKLLDEAPPGPGGLASPAGTLVYPYDRTVFARGLISPELMWNGGSAGDAYLVSFSEPGFEAKLYAKLDAPGRFLVPQSVWDGLAASNHGEPAKVRVVRVSGGKVVGEMTETWFFAQGSLRGTIYYWTVNKGQLVKIGPGADHPELVFDSGSADDLGAPAPANYDNTKPPWSVGTEGKRCVACHTLSKDGSRLVGIFESKSNPASPWGSIDVAGKKVTAVGRYDRGLFQPTLTPNGSHAVLVDGGFSLVFGDAGTGAELPSALGAAAGKAAMPMFAPDGKAMAFASEVEGSYPVEFGKSNLSVMTFDAAGLAFGGKKQIAAGNGQAIAYPTFTPDSERVVYQKGSFSRAKYGKDEHGICDLFLTDAAGSGAETKLALLGGEGMVEPRNLHLAYEPRVNPIAVGGYAWVVFVSPRDYGNRMVSKADPTYENRKQLWVAAVDLDPKPGVDPSHPAFLLRGQDLTTTNMSGYWALDPCRSTGTSCAAGYECCTGFCRPDAEGKPVCVGPPGSGGPGTMGEAGASSGKGGSASGGSSSGGTSGKGGSSSGGSSSGKGGTSSGKGGTAGSTGTGEPGNGESCSRIDEKCTTSGDCCDPSVKCIGGFCAIAAPP